MANFARHFIAAVLLLITSTRPASAQNAGSIPIITSRFITCDDPAYKASGYDDSKWETLKTGIVWQEQGHEDYHGYAWYRIHVKIPGELKEKGFWKDSLRIFLAHVNDVDETFLNGKRIGHIGSFPDEPGGYVSKWPAIREYHVSVSDEAIKWDADNVIAVRVYDGGGSGGIFMGQPYVDMLEKINGIQIESPETEFISPEKVSSRLSVANRYNTAVSGIFRYTIFDAATGRSIGGKKQKLTLRPFEVHQLNISVPQKPGIELNASFTEEKSGYTANIRKTFPYILTPPVSLIPRINGPAVFGVQAGHPLLYKIPATGERPIQYSAAGLPAELQLNAITGIITGSIAREGNYPVRLTVKNKRGSADRLFTIHVGKPIALTPPMGWNSWNCWGLSVSDAKVRSSAQALIDKGLIDHGWTYINIDDGWEAAKRAPDGSIVSNEKFPDMKGLGDFLHNRGLKFGIYSSPGVLTCGGYIGSYKHELSDANTYAGWGIDYLKYDLCSYLDSMHNKESLREHEVPYEIMRDALAKQNRDIVYSMCQYGLKSVWKWGREMDGNSWRTTEDIEDTWQSLYAIGFGQDSLGPYAGPGGWNDPDMLIVGMVGWGENLHPTRLTPDEQYTHISLWSLLSAPLLIGCDISRLDRFTTSLLSNDEVIAIDQDILGKQARRLINKDSIQVYVKDLADGNRAVGIFNTSNVYKKYTFHSSELGLENVSQIRDVWRQKNIAVHEGSIEETLPPHGVFLFTLKNR